MMFQMFSYKNRKSRNHVRLWLRRNGWLLFLLGMLLGCGMSIWGFWLARDYYFDANNKLRWADVIYYTLQMIPLYGFGPVNPDTPWPLNFARFWLPAVFFFTAATSLLRLVGRSRLGVSRFLLYNHVIICGSGSHALGLVRQYRQRSRPIAVLLIVDSVSFPEEEEIRDLGAYILMENITTTNCWRYACFSRAKAIYIVAKDELSNLKAFEALCNLGANSKHKNKSISRCFIHLSDPDLRRWIIQKLETSENRQTQFRWIFFSALEDCVRDLFLYHGPHVGLNANDTHFQPSLLILGFNTLAEQLILQAAKLGHYPNATKLSITVVANNVGLIQRSIEARFPALSAQPLGRWQKEEVSLIPLVNIRYVDSPPDAPQDEIFNNSREPVYQYQICFICIDDASTAIKTVEMLRAQMCDSVHRKLPLRVVLCLPDNDSLLGQVIRDGAWLNEQSIGTDNLIVFDPVAHSCRMDSREELLRERSEQVAINMHRFYLKGQDFDWYELSEEERDSNRQAADHLLIKRGFIHCSDEQLMESEHMRWCAERLLKGWRYSPNKSIRDRLNPNLRCYDDLPATEQAKNRLIVDYVRALDLDSPPVLQGHRY